MDNPVPFILTGDDGTSLAVDSKAKEALSKIKKPVVVVSVVGMYRTGKSFLLNRLMNRTDGFPLGATVEAKTKGIWMWVGLGFYIATAMRNLGSPVVKGILLYDT